MSTADDAPGRCMRGGGRMASAAPAAVVGYMRPHAWPASEHGRTSAAARQRRLLVVALTCALQVATSVLGVSCDSGDGVVVPRLFTYDLVAEYPHDPRAFTQGLEYDRVCDDNTRVCHDVLWESTGLNGESSVRKVALASGEMLQRKRLKDDVFGEGLTRINNTIYQLTWRTGKGLMFSAPSMERLGSFTTELKDGWGLANNGTHLLATDSGHKVYFIEINSFQTVKTLTVTHAGNPLPWANELEFIDGDLWANVWSTECLARIDLSSGAVTAWYLLHGLKERVAPRAHRLDVMNGIAWDASGRRLFVTGKWWPAVFEVRPRPFAPGKAPDAKLVHRLCHPSGNNAIFGD